MSGSPTSTMTIVARRDANFHTYFANFLLQNGGISEKCVFLYGINHTPGKMTVFQLRKARKTGRLDIRAVK